MHLPFAYQLNPLGHSFGLDIGDRSFKLVQLATASRGRPRIVAWNSIEVPDGIMRHGEIADPARASEILTRLLDGAHGRLSGASVVACLPEEKTYVKMAAADREASDDGLREKVIAEIRNNVPLPLDELYYDFQPVRTVTGTDGVNRTAVLFGAAPRALVDTYASLLDRAGLETVALEIEATAISRANIPEGRAESEPVGVLDIGATRSSLIVVEDGILRMSIGIPVSGIAITETIGRALGIESGAAEKLKRECGLDATRCEDRMWNILLPLIDDMIAKIKNALRYYHVAFPEGRKVENLLLCGGGAQFREIDAVLSRGLTIKVRRADPLCNLDPRLPKDFPASEALQYATAVGLALRAVDEQYRYEGGLPKKTV